MTRVFSYLFGVLGGMGMIDALYLSLEHARNVVPTCIVFDRCATVLTSPYAYMFGIPLAYIGFVFYAALFFCGLFIIMRGWTRPLSIVAVGMAAAAAIASGILFSIQAFVIGAFCLYCVLSELISVCIAGVVGAMAYTARRGLARPGY
ncbi:MAG: vitamin K epoxide reductase family protein [Candidatus Liptonbacteria bacterium]|nr:vitamin K epoxide reductase family protein [Candidatus Liptonbacteria bacterium]